MNHITRRRWLWIAIAAGCAAAAVLAFRPRPLAVETAAAARGPMQVTLDDQGETRVLDRFLIAAPVAGRLQRIVLRAGGRVRQGDVVARIQPAPLDPRERERLQARVQAAGAARQAAAAEVARARASLTQAERDRDRDRRLGEKNVIAPQELEQAELAAAVAQRGLEAAQYREQVAQYELSEARAGLLSAEGEAGGRGRVLQLRAPVAGRVFRVNEENERVVAAGAPLIELGDPGAMEVVTDVLSADAVQIRPGDPALIEDWGGPAPLAATVRTVEPSAFTKVSALGVEEQRVNVVLTLPHPPPALGDRFRVETRIVVWQAADVLRIPASALFRRGDAWNVFVVANGRARLRPLTIGHRSPDWAEVLSGLAAGTPVITYPSSDITDGVRVTPAR